MRKFFKFTTIICISVSILTSCANSKTFEIEKNQEYLKVEPYGWFYPEQKNPNINYQINIGNVIWSCILVETVVAPIIITGTALWEPVSLKECYPNCK
jgi:hypothetical protein